MFSFGGSECWRRASGQGPRVLCDGCLLCADALRALPVRLGAHFVVGASGFGLGTALGSSKRRGKCMETAGNGREGTRIALRHRFRELRSRVSGRFLLFDAFLKQLRCGGHGGCQDLGELRRPRRHEPAFKAVRGDVQDESLSRRLPFISL